MTAVLPHERFTAFECDYSLLLAIITIIVRVTEVFVMQSLKIWLFSSSVVRSLQGDNPPTVLVRLKKQDSACVQLSDTLP
jgi:hypothetical protein